VKKKNPRIGSSFESWLDETGIREDVTVAAIKSVLARQPAAAQLDRLLDPDNGGATIESHQRACGGDGHG